MSSQRLRMGQKQTSSRVGSMSALPSTADIQQGDGYLSFVPNPDVADIGGAKKSRSKAASEFKPDDRRSGGHQCWL
jgi:hypothetical protein